MIIKDVGILGTGLWQGPAVGNDFFGLDYLKRATVKDPFKGKRSDDGVVRMAGLALSPEKHGRTLAAIAQSYDDPYRGAVKRRYFPADLQIAQAETEAAAAAISDAGLKPQDIDAVLVQSLLPDELLIKDATHIAYNLGIGHAPAWNVDSVCTSAITQAHLAASFIKSGQGRHVLCIQSVAYSRIMDMTTSAAVVVGDMASAFVVGPQPGTQFAFSWRTDGRLHRAIRLQWENARPSEQRPYWAPSQERLALHFDNEMQAEATGELPQYAAPVCTEAAARAEMRLDEIETFIPHQPLVWFPALLDDLLGLRDGVSFNTFTEYANVNASSIVASLHEARRAGRIRRGSNVLMFVPGGGYVYGALAIRW